MEKTKKVRVRLIETNNSGNYKLMTSIFLPNQPPELVADFEIKIPEKKYTITEKQLEDAFKYGCSLEALKLSLGM